MRRICQRRGRFIMRVVYLVTIAACVSVLVGCLREGPVEEEEPQPLKPLLAVIQDAVAKTDSAYEQFYEREYRPEEPLRWTKIAGWMVEDAIERQYPKAKPLAKILDLGCGFGTLLAFATTIYGVEGVCVDVVPYIEGKDNLRELYHLSFVEGSIERDPLPGPEKFGVIIFTEVLEHLNFKPVPTLLKIWNSLEEGGTLFLSTPDSDAGWGRNYKHYQRLSDIPAVNPEAEWLDDHIWHYNKRELIGVLTDAGFKIKRIDHSYSPGGGHFNVWAVK